MGDGSVSLGVHRQPEPTSFTVLASDMLYILVLHICELDYSRCKMDYYSNIIVGCELDYLRCYFCIFANTKLFYLFLHLVDIS